MNNTRTNSLAVTKLDDEAVVGLVSLPEAIDALDAAFKDLAAGKAGVLARQRIDWGLPTGANSMTRRCAAPDTSLSSGYRKA